MSHIEKCKTCNQKQRGFWTYANCKTSWPKQCCRRHVRQQRSRNGTQTCDACLANWKTLRVEVASELPERARSGRKASLQKFGVRLQRREGRQLRQRSQPGTLLRSLLRGQAAQLTRCAPPLSRSSKIPLHRSILCMTSAAAET